MSATTPNPQQRAAIDARGTVFVSAGAGTGKTTVLVERFVTAVCDDGLDVGSLLAITYTDRAAGELRSRIAARLRERGRPDLARELDVAWISTIHGFCRRLLAQYTVAAGVDPRFRVLDEAQARVLQGEAFGVALERFCADDDADRLQLLATYGAGGLRRMLTSVYETLRSAGRELRLEPGSRLDLDACVVALQGEASALAGDPAATRAQAAAAAETLDVLAAGDDVETLLDLASLSARGARAAAFNDARRAVVDAAARGAGGAGPRAARGAAARLRRRLPGGEGRRVCARLRGSAASGARPAARRRGGAGARADAVPLDPRGRVPGHESASSVELVDLHRGRAAEGPLLRRRRVPVDLRLPPRRRGRLPRAPGCGRTGAAADAELPLAARGARCRQPPVRAGVRRRVRAARACRRLRRPAIRGTGRARRLGQGVVPRGARPLASGGGAGGRAPRGGARRGGRSDARRDRLPLRRRHRRRGVRGGAPRGRATDPPRHRPQVLRAAAGRRPARLP